MNELKILVVDDESRMRKLVKDFLTRAGYQVLEAQDGEEAVDTFYSTKGINLLVLDVMMPKMDGWEVVKEIRKVSNFLDLNLEWMNIFLNHSVRRFWLPEWKPF